MNHEPQLYAARIGELEELISAHLAAGSLDEGNAAAFDTLIEAWLREELARVDDAAATAARRQVEVAKEQAADAARLRAERFETKLRAEALQAERDRRGEATRRRSERLAEARRTRRLEQLVLAEERLHEAAARLKIAERLLLGDLAGDGAARPAPLAPMPDGTAEEKVA